MKEIMNVKGREISVFSKGKENDYISLTDIAKYKNPDDPRFVIQNWMRTRFTMEFMGFWEQMYNPDFNRVEFEAVKNEAGSNAFVMTPTKWVRLTNAIGISSKAGRYGGTFAHKDIAFEFASWISAEFKLYIIKDYQRLKTDENSHISLEWNVNRVISKINYKIHTDAIKENLIPKLVSPRQQSFTYARGIDTGIILTQAALERLSFEFSVRERKLLLTKGFKDLWASDKFRLLFSSLGIPLGIPPECPNLKAIASKNGWADSPHALTEIRNSLVHPENKKRGKFNDAIYEAWNLGLWYLEQSILALCNYSGTYSNRLKHHWVGQVENVSWVPGDTN